LGPDHRAVPPAILGQALGFLVGRVERIVRQQMVVVEQVRLGRARSGHQRSKASAAALASATSGVGIRKKKAVNAAAIATPVLSKNGISVSNPEAGSSKYISLTILM